MKDAEFLPHLHSCLQLLKVKGKKLIDFWRSWVTVLKIYISKSNRSFQEVEISSVQSCWIIQFKSRVIFSTEKSNNSSLRRGKFSDYISKLHLFAKNFRSLVATKNKFQFKKLPTRWYSGLGRSVHKMQVWSNLFLTFPFKSWRWCYCFFYWRINKFCIKCCLFLKQCFWVLLTLSVKKKSFQTIIGFLDLMSDPAL